MTRTVIDALPLLPIFNTSVIALVAILVITRKLVWHTDLRREEARADKWEGVALRLLGVSERLTVSAEVANEVLTRLPDPGRVETGDQP